jgi:Family of unknown function (DUF5343)
MALLNQSVQVYGQLPKILEAMREGQAPSKFTRQFLKDLGFASSNHHALIPLLKGLGFLSADGAPTHRYKDFLDKTKWKKVLAEAIREAYSDIFVLKAKPTKEDKDLIAGKYKSTFNVSDTAADRAAATFLSLLSLADEGALYGSESPKATSPSVTAPVEALPIEYRGSGAGLSVNGLHYNIQIHLPATKDVEVYNAIFKSLRVNLGE